LQPAGVFPDIINISRSLHGQTCGLWRRQELGPDHHRKAVRPDLESAKALNNEVNRCSTKTRYSASITIRKETVQNILVFRFANASSRNVWNRNYIDHVEITAAESIGIEGRGPFYETAGALRDVVQNHVMELLIVR